MQHRMHTRGSFALLVTASLALGTAASTSGCATVTRLATGAFTGAVDAPAQVYRTHREGFAEDPIYWPLNVCIFVPLGIAFGPLVGFCKGVALDCGWVVGKTDYAQVFGGYAEPSIWRPYTIHW